MTKRVHENVHVLEGLDSRTPNLNVGASGFEVLRSGRVNVPGQRDDASNIFGEVLGIEESTGDILAYSSSQNKMKGAWYPC